MAVIQLSDMDKPLSYASLLLFMQIQHVQSSSNFELLGTSYKNML